MCSHYSTKFTLLKNLLVFFLSFFRFKSLIEKQRAQNHSTSVRTGSQSSTECSNIDFELHNVIYFHSFRPDSLNRLTHWVQRQTAVVPPVCVFKSQCVFPNSCEHDVQQPRVERQELHSMRRENETTEKERNE